ncbi:MAG: hypothetical protein IKO93_14370 [Lentisphaeria bacterium]|nr:hypothetical protein [Lentisphaeria bacterium]
MKKGDVGAIVFLVVFACAVVFFPWTVTLTGKVELGKLTQGFDNFGKFTAHFPYLMGFFKVGLLATFGEMLKVRMKTGSWKVPSLIARFIVWGIVGLLFTFVFAMFAKGVGGLIGTPLWFGRMTLKPDFGDKLLFAFSTSFWQNVIFAYPMMLGHEWCNEVINRKRFVGGAEFLEKLNKPVWGSFIPKTIVFFWIPAHTVTFLLPADYRVLMSAVLSLVLGAILTFRSGK